MTPNQLTRAAELAPDCPIIALALMLRMAEMPEAQATYEELATEAIPKSRVVTALDAAWAIGLAWLGKNNAGFTDAGRCLMQAVTDDAP